MNKWARLANCRGVSGHLFFSEKAADVAKAKECCDACPVRQPCREHARACAEEGTWGGETESERRQARPVRVGAVRSTV